jgi:hypothetical protein
MLEMKSERGKRRYDGYVGYAGYEGSEEATDVRSFLILSPRNN